MKLIRFIHSNTKGSLYFFVLVLLLVMITMGALTFKFTSSSEQNSTYNSQQKQSFYIAESGLERAKKILDTLTPEQFSAIMNPQSGNPGTFLISDDANGKYEVTISGNYDPKFLELNNGTVELFKPVNIKILVVGKEFNCYQDAAGQNYIGPIDVLINFSRNNGVNWEEINSNTGVIEGDLFTINNVLDKSKFVLQIKAAGSGQCSGEIKTLISNLDTIFLLSFRNGDTLPPEIVSSVAAKDQKQVKNVLKNYLSNNNVISNIQHSQVLYICELSKHSFFDYHKAGLNWMIDYQDLVLLVTFEPSDSLQNGNFTLRSTATVRQTKTILEIMGTKSFTDKTMKITSWKEL